MKKLFLLFSIVFAVIFVYTTQTNAKEQSDDVVSMSSSSNEDIAKKSQSILMLVM